MFLQKKKKKQKKKQVQNIVFKILKGYYGKSINSQALIFQNGTEGSSSNPFLKNKMLYVASYLFYNYKYKGTGLPL